MLSISLFFVAADTMVWVILIMGMAGPMMVAGLHEGLLDYKILKTLEKRTGMTQRAMMVRGVHGDNDGATELANMRTPNAVDAMPQEASRNTTAEQNGEALNTNQIRAISLNTKVELLVAIFAGKILLHNDFHNLIPNVLLARPLVAENLDQPILAETLIRLMTSQSPFGAIVGAPVVFYLGAFIYTILDLLVEPSNQNAAYSLAFGVEWMIIVHVAIVNGYLLASNNPSPINMLVGTRRGQDERDERGVPPLFPPVYDGIFQPVSMWRRGINKRKWLNKFKDDSNRPEHNSTDIKADLKIHLWEWVFLIALPSVILISLPPGAGAFVTYATPTVGFGCRSLSFLLYFGVQIILTPIYFATTHWESENSNSDSIPCALGRRIVWAFYWSPFVLVFIISIFLSIGGTTMRILGVYRNCFLLSQCAALV
jgi:hypothetical protein